MEISDVHGEVIQLEEQRIDHDRVLVKKDLSGFSAGVYIFKFINNDNTIIKKIVVK